MKNEQVRNRELLTPLQFQEIIAESQMVASSSRWLSRHTLLTTSDGRNIIRETELSQGSGTMIQSFALFDEAGNIDQIHWRNASIGYSGHSRNPGHVVEPSDSDRRRFGDAYHELRLSVRR
jgi:hypothetical protein